MIVPTRRLATLLALWGVALLFLGAAAGPAFVVGNLVLVVAVLTDRLACPAPATVEIVRRVPDVVAREHEVTLAWEVTNPTGRAQRVRLADELPPSWRCTDRRAAVTVPAGATATVTRTLRPARRGRFDLGGVTVRVVGPLGLVARQRRRPLPGRVRVYPAFPSRAEVLLRLDRARVAEVGLRATSGRGGGTDFESLREYEIDDETRRLDWAATARVGRPIVRTYRVERNQHVMLLVDTGRAMAQTVAGVTRLEATLDAVLALALVAARVGDKVGLLSHDDRARSSLRPTTRPDRAAVLLETVYELEPRLVETDYAALFARLASTARRRCLVVVLTDLAEGVTAASLQPALRLAARRHLVVVAAVSDPELIERADGPAGNAAGAFRKAAAARTLEERSVLAAQLGQLGVQVVDAPPRALAVRLVDLYLDAKARGRL